MVMGYWSVAIVAIDRIVNVLNKRCGLAKTRLRHPSLPFDNLPYPTRTICRPVRTYVRSVSHVTTKRKEVYDIQKRVTPKRITLSQISGFLGNQSKFTF